MSVSLQVWIMVQVCHVNEITVESEVGSLRPVLPDMLCVRAISVYLLLHASSSLMQQNLAPFDAAVASMHRPAVLIEAFTAVCYAVVVVY